MGRSRFITWAWVLVFLVVLLFLVCALALCTGSAGIAKYQAEAEKLKQ